MAQWCSGAAYVVGRDSPVAELLEGSGAELVVDADPEPRDIIPLRRSWNHRWLVQ